MKFADQSLSFDQQVELWGRWVEKRRDELDARAHFVSVTFDRYRNRHFRKDAFAGQGAEDVPITRHDVLAGQTRRLSPSDSAAAYVSDVNRWYLRVLSKLFGGQYRDFGEHHPFGIGWIDQPAAKKLHTFNQNKLLPGVEFPNAHFVMVVPRMNYSGGPDANTVDRFYRLWQHGSFNELWKKWNPESDLRIDFCHTIDYAVRYAAKTAQRDRILQEHMIILPFNRTASRSSVLLDCCPGSMGSG